MVEVLHVVVARGLEIQQHRRVAAHAIQGVQIDVIAHAAGNSGQMHDAIGGAADGQQHTHRVLEGCGRENLVNGEALAREAHGLGAGTFGHAEAIRRHGGR